MCKRGKGLKGSDARDMEAQLAEVEEELNDYLKNLEKVIAEQRPSDEYHCSCCTELRAEVLRLREEIDKLEFLASEYQKEKEALREENYNLQDLIREAKDYD